MKEQIDRLGFEAWADNVIVNWLEGMTEMQITDAHFDHDDLSLVIRRHKDTATATVRGYVPGRGWLTHERTIKLKGAKP